MRYGRETGPGANVGEPTKAYGNGSDAEETFSEVEAKNLERINDSGERDFLIPAEEQIDVGSERCTEGRSWCEAIDFERPRDGLVSEAGRFHTMYIV